MNIAVLSGKGGTGKTTVSTNLAKIMNLNYVDCDVEEPNGHIFLKPDIMEKKEVTVPVPKVNSSQCDLCGKCAQACQFNALAKTMTGIMLFKELCHGCGACSIVCTQDAIQEDERSIGIISIGEFEKQLFMSGKLNIKEPMAGPIISELRRGAPENGDTLIDCSPGTSCNVVKALDGSDYAVMVTEPTQFGLHDLKLAVSLVRDMKIPFGVLINRSNESTGMVKAYCESESIKVIGEIPYSRRAAELYSKGLMLSDDIEHRKSFVSIASNLRQCLDALKEQAGEACS